GEGAGGAGGRLQRGGARRDRPRPQHAGASRHAESGNPPAEALHRPMPLEASARRPRRAGGRGSVSTLPASGAPGAVEFGLGRRDARNAARYLSAIDGDIAAAHREAVRLVRQHWDAIERVADALAERGRLSGAEVDALIGPSRGKYAAMP